jgi:hypothetical protein
MIYPMAQSVALVCVEIDKKMPPQWHCPLSIVIIGNPLSIIRNHFSIQILNFDFIVSKTPQRANKTPYLQGTGAPRHYPHTLIAFDSGQILRKHLECMQQLLNAK